MNKKILGTVLLVIVVIGLIMFGIQSSPNINKTTDNVTQEPIKLGIVPYPGFGAPYIADEKGFFTDENVNVEIILLSADTMIPALESGEVQMLVGSADTMAIISDAGINAKAILSTSVSYGADGLVVKDTINNIADLKGQKVHLALGFPAHFLFRFLAEQEGLSPKDVELVNLNPDQVGSAFVSGSIDSGVTWEPWLSRATERKDGKVLLTSYENPGIITDIIMARDDLIENRREDIRRFMRAFFNGTYYWEINHDSGDEIVAKNFNLSKEEFSPMRDTVKLSSYEFNMRKFDNSQSLNIYELIEKAGDLYLIDEVITIKPNPSNLVDASLLQNLY